VQTSVESYDVTVDDGFVVLHLSRSIPLAPGKQK
jgi:hypothetical protein